MSQNRRLYLLRHAKSAWDNPEQPDHERPLADRGRRSVGVIRAYMESQKIEPELVLCSSARRTRETLEGVSPRSTAIIEHRLYGASSFELLERLRQVPPQLTSVMIVGHNPALQMLSLALAGSERPSRRRGAEGLEAIRRKLPTGALVTLEFSGAWAQLAIGCAQLIDYARPKAL